MTIVRTLAPAAVLVVAAASVLHAQESVTFPSLDGETTVMASVSRPPGDDRKPAIILLHGCSGLSGADGKPVAIYRAWIRTLVTAGYVVLAVDSAKSRGFGQTCTGGPLRRIMYRDRPKDAYAALGFLSAQPFVDPERIALMGWSQGGAIVLLSINDKSIGKPPGAEREFKAAISFYPGACSEKLQSKPFTEVEPHQWTTRVPLLVMMGEADNWTRFAPCRSFLDDARTRGNPVEMKSYPRAVHGFDAPNADRRELPAYRLDDGTVPVVETDDAARADAVLRSLAFLKQHFGG